MDIAIAYDKIVIPATSNLAKIYWEKEIGSCVVVVVHTLIGEVEIGYVTKYIDAGGIKDSLKIATYNGNEYTKYLPDDSKNIFWVPTTEDLINIAFDLTKDLAISQIRRYKEKVFLATAPSINTLTHSSIKTLLALIVSLKVNADKSMFIDTIVCS